MTVGVSVLTNTGDLPTDLHMRSRGLDAEAVAFDLLDDDGLGELADDRELVAKVTIERLKVVRQFNRGFSAGIGDRIAVVDVFHVGRLDKRVIEILIFGVERVVNLERAAAFREIAGYSD